MEKKNKTKIATQIFGILQSVAEGKQTFFLGLITIAQIQNLWWLVENKGSAWVKKEKETPQNKQTNLLVKKVC